MDYERQAGKTFLEKGNTYSEKRVACVGAGPASLACAAELAKEGVEVTIFDQHKEAGGMLRYLIPPYRLPEQILNQDLEQLEKLGVRFELNHYVSTEEMEKLKEEYDHVFVGTGMWGAKTLPIPGCELDGVVTAIDFLQQAKENNGKQNSLGAVVIIGGGDVAMDCAATSKLLGATSIYDVFIETLEDAPAVQQEKDFVFQLGVPLISEFKPVEIIGNSKVERVRFEHITNGSTMEIKADTVIFAVGQSLTDDGKVWVDDQGLLTGGDMVNGGDTVVRAIYEGKEAAAKILESFRG